MDVKIVDLPEIAIIGKEGFCTEEENIVQYLWKQANENFGEVAELGMKEKETERCSVRLYGTVNRKELFVFPNRGLIKFGLTKAKAGFGKSYL